MTTVNEMDTLRKMCPVIAEDLIFLKIKKNLHVLESPRTYKPILMRNYLDVCPSEREFI